MAPAPAPNYQAIAAQAAGKYGINPNIFLSQIKQESGFNPNARSGAGAQGIAQFMPATAAGMGVDPWNPRQALFGAAKMDAENIAKYGNWQRALSAYNSGKPDVYTDPSFAGGQTYDYVRTIMAGAKDKSYASAIAQGWKSGSAGGAPPDNAPPPSPKNPLSTAMGLQGPTQSQAKLRNFLLQGAQNLLSGKELSPQAMMQAFKPSTVAQPSQMPSAPQTPGLQKTNRVLASAGAQADNGSMGQRLVETARTQLGNPYQWGGPAELGKNTDCSGLIQATYGANGIQIPRTTYDQWKVGTPVPINKMEPGDAIYFHMGPQGPEHVGMYVGNGNMIEDPHTGDVVKIQSLTGYDTPVGVRRFGNG